MIVIRQSKSKVSRWHVGIPTNRAYVPDDCDQDVFSSGSYYFVHIIQLRHTIMFMWPEEV